jgi:CubicO group peptidase (beta-lactamase class C family)
MLSESSDAASELAQNIDMAIDGISITPLDGGQPMTSRRAFDATFSDGILAPHHGRIVHERYASCLDEQSLHGAMSVTKSLTGSLGEMLVADGKLDDGAGVGSLPG